VIIFRGPFLLQDWLWHGCILCSSLLVTGDRYGY